MITESYCRHIRHALDRFLIIQYLMSIRKHKKKHKREESLLELHQKKLKKKKKVSFISLPFL